MSEAASKAVIVVHRAVRVLLLIVVPLVAVVAGLYVYATGGQEVETDNAYVKANIVPISAAVTGRVIEVLARDNQPVEVGAVLFRLDPVPYQIAVDGARGDAGNLVLNWSMDSRLDIAGLSGGRKRIMLTGVNWQRYTLFGSTDLFNWFTNIPTITMSGTSHGFTNNGGLGRQFYRAVRSQ